MEEDRQERINAVLESVVDVEEKKEDGLIHFSTGVVLGKRPIPKQTAKILYDRFEETKPTPPMFYNPNKNRDEPNPADPDYLAALEEHQVDFLLGVIDFAILKGTYVIEKPDEIEDLDGEDWLEELEYLGITIPKSKKLRYLLWVKYVAAITDEDQKELLSQSTSLLGVSEAAVEQEMSKFPSDEERASNSESSPEVSS